MRTLPDTVSAYKRTPEFNQDTVPKGLLKAHQTKIGVWGKIIVLKGELEYTINAPEQEVILLDEQTQGIVEPAILHQIKPLGEVQFYIEFYR